jgi:MOSC domain-containing protein YiiM
MYKIVSVNVGTATPFEHTTPGITGIFKKPQIGPVEIGPYGLKDDAICDTKHHGGLDQAVYLYGVPDYDYWESEIGHALEPGTFGENLTVENLESGKICIGDRFTLGALILEVTSPRIPCRTFAARMDDKLFVKKFLAANRPGIYCRVLATGVVAAGDVLNLVPYDGIKLPIIEMNQTWNRMDLDAETKARYLSTPIHSKERAKWSV